MVEREEERGAGDKVMNVIELENAVNKFVLLPMARGAMIAGRLLLLRMPHPGHAELAPQNFGGPCPLTTPPMAPQIKPQNQGFLNFGSFLWRAACSRGVGARARPLARRISCTEFGIGSTFRHNKFCIYCLFTLRISECASCPFILS